MRFWKESENHEKILIACIAIFLIVLGVAIKGLIDTIVANNQAQTANKEFTKIAPSMTFFGEDNNHWRYYADDRTNVIYIVRYANGISGITPAYNTDGTLMTRDQFINE